MVTHDPVAASYADQVVLLADGVLAGSLTAPTAEQVADRMTHLGARSNLQVVAG
jgi:putative ABC transport system ATP-binding protein